MKAKLFKTLNNKILTPRLAKQMFIDTNDKKTHIMHTKEIRNEGITSLLQTLNQVVPSTKKDVNWMTTVPQSWANGQA